MRSVDLLEFLFPVSQPGHLWFLQICLHAGSLHTGMPVIPEFTLRRAEVRKGRRLPTTFKLLNYKAQKPTPPLPDFEFG